MSILTRIFLFIFLILTINIISAQEVVINEFLASNVSGVTDKAGDHDDWIELYNCTNEAIDLSAWSLSDDRDDPQKAILPAGTTVPAQGFLLLWADGEPEQVELHLNFRISTGGEWIGLFNPEAEIADSVSFGHQLTDISFGRYPDGSDTSFYQLSPTPGHANILQYTCSLTITPAEGLYESPVTVHLMTNSPEREIRYTLDGNDVTADSDVCNGKLTLKSSCAVKAQVFRQGKAVSPITYHTYIVKEKPKLPVLSVITPMKNLWHHSNGIYRNPLKRGRDWERKVWLTLIENEEVKFSVPAGIRIHGELSRNCDKKGFRLYFRDDYGLSTLHYHLFPQKPNVDRFERLILYAPSYDQPTGDTNYSHITDALTHTLLHEIGGLTSAYKPVSLYLNGEYWGIYWIREFIDEHYLTSNCNISEDIDLLRFDCKPEPLIRKGDAQYWYKTENFIHYQNISADSIYTYITKYYINIANYIDYHIVNFYAGNWDWLDENVDWYRSRTGDDPRWYWILWDTDKAWKWCECGNDINVLKSKTENNKWYNLILRRLLSNQTFRHRFINRYADLMNTTFRAEHVSQIIDTLVHMISNEMPREENRWRDSSLPAWARWKKNVNHLRYVTHKRTAKEREHVQDYFNEITGLFEITVPAPQGNGIVRINSLKVNTYPFVGTYFKGIPITVTAVPEYGYTFTGWEEQTLDQQQTIKQTFSGNQHFTAVFQPCASAQTVVITEINYHSAAYHDPEDWVELYNPTAESIDLTGWTFSDGSQQNEFVFPEHAVIGPEGYMVLVRDSMKFHMMFPKCESCTGPLGFGLSGAGESIQLWNAQGTQIDSVSYDDQMPWPGKPDGKGPTLELIDAILDNTDPEHWQASEHFGSPGTSNDQEKNFLSAWCDSVIITEINYHSAPETDAGDWCELCNCSSQNIVLSGWSFCDEDGNAYQLPVSFLLASHSWVVLAEDSVLFQTVFPEVTNFTGNLGFGLNNAGEFLCVKDVNGLFVDSLRYDDQAPWPPEPDGNGPTLELTDLCADNNDPENWQASTETGTPGQANNQDTTTTVENPAKDHALTFALLPSYPNPFNPDTRIPYTIPRTAKVTVQIYDVLGRVVKTWKEKQPPGTHQIHWDGRDVQKQFLPAGVYIVRFRAGQFQAQSKLILLK